MHRLARGRGSDPLLEHLISGVSANAPEEARIFYANVESVLSSTCSSRAMHEFVDGCADVDAQLWKAAASLGWFGLGNSEEGPASGLGVEGYVSFHRALGRFVAPGPYIATLSSLRVLSESKDDGGLAPILSGGYDGTVALALPASSDEARIELSGGKLSGRIRMLGARASAFVAHSYALVPVVRGDTASWALVDCDGSRVASEMVRMWDRTREVDDLTLEGVEPLHVIADPAGLMAERLATYVDLAVAADSLGGAAAVAAKTVEYLNQRVQFGRALGSFQALKHRAANLMLRIVTSEQLLAQGSSALGQDSSDAALWASLAKASATKTYSFVSGDCVQLHGGVGHTWDFDCHLYLKRARLNEVLWESQSRAADRAGALLMGALRHGEAIGELDHGA